MKNIEFSPIDPIVLKKVLDKYGFCEQFDLNGEKLVQMEKFANIMLDWNTRMNLTGIIDSEEVADKHFADSLFLLKYLPVSQSAKVIDVGTGAGFPAMPCMIARPDLNFTLLDGLQKRITFLNTVCSELDLKAECLHGRAEEIARKAEYRERFDVATARAVAHLRELSEYCLPYVKIGGVFAALKGRDITVELDEAKGAIAKLGGKIENVIEYQLADGSERTIVIVRKISGTAAKYPRASVKMKKEKL